MYSQTDSEVNMGSICYIASIYRWIYSQTHSEITSIIHHNQNISSIIVLFFGFDYKI